MISASRYLLTLMLIAVLVVSMTAGIALATTSTSWTPTYTALFAPASTNMSWVQTTTSDFEQGTSDNVLITADNITLPDCATSGNFTSQIYDSGVWAVWDNVTWSWTSNGQEARIKVRTSDNATMVGATPWDECSYLSLGCGPLDLSSVDSVTNGHRYIQWRVELFSYEACINPVIHDVTVNYSYTPPYVEAADEAGTTTNTYYPDQTVYVTAGGLPANSSVDVYIVGDQDWTDGDTIPDDVRGDYDTLVSDASGNIGPVAIWMPPLIPGAYDIVIDVDDQNGVYDADKDCVDSGSPGFVVYPPTIGGEVYPINTMAVLMPWLALATVLILATGSGALILRRRRTQRAS